MYILCVLYNIYIYIYIYFIYGRGSLVALLVLLLWRDQYPKVWGNVCAAVLGVVRREGVGADKLSPKSDKSLIY